MPGSSGKPVPDPPGILERRGKFSLDTKRSSAYGSPLRPPGLDGDKWRRARVPGQISWVR